MALLEALKRQELLTEREGLPTNNLQTEQNLPIFDKRASNEL